MCIDFKDSPDVSPVRSASAVLVDVHASEELQKLAKPRQQEGDLEQLRRGLHDLTADVSSASADALAR